TNVCEGFGQDLRSICPSGYQPDRFSVRTSGPFALRAVGLTDSRSGPQVGSGSGALRRRAPRRNAFSASRLQRSAILIPLTWAASGKRLVAVNPGSVLTSRSVTSDGESPTTKS